jgi:hypothetical protein
MDKKLNLKRETVKKLIPVKTDIRTGKTTAITCTCPTPQRTVDC